MIEKIVMTILISIIVAVVYSSFALAVAAYLHENGKNYKEVK